MHWKVQTQILCLSGLNAGLKWWLFSCSAQSDLSFLFFFFFLFSVSRVLHCWYNKRLSWSKNKQTNSYFGAFWRLCMCKESQTHRLFNKSGLGTIRLKRLEPSSDCHHLSSFTLVIPEPAWRQPPQPAANSHSPMPMNPASCKYF